MTNNTPLQPSHGQTHCHACKQLTWHAEVLLKQYTGNTKWGYVRDWVCTECRLTKTNGLLHGEADSTQFQMAQEVAVGMSHKLQPKRSTSGPDLPFGNK